LSPDPTRPRAVVLISGGGSNLQSIIDASASGQIDLEIAAVLSNVEGVRGLRRAADAGIATRVIRNTCYESRDAFDAALVDYIDPFAPQVVVLAGFMRILTADFVNHYRGRLINIHPSLLPAYPGLDTHRRVLDAGDEMHGCTVHFVTPELDAGPSIIQGRVPVRVGDDADRLAARVLEIEHRIYPIAADLVASGRAVFDGAQVTLDGKPMTAALRYESLPDDIRLVAG